MFAVIKTGGKQYVVKEGDSFSVEKLDLPAGQKFLFDQILLVDDGSDTAIGTPILEKAAVKAEVIRNFKDDKILVFKKKRRKQYRRTHGHRQNLTEVKIEKIYPDKTVVPADELRFEVLASVAVEKTAPAPAPKPRTAKAPKAAEPVEAKPAPRPKAKSKAKAKAKPAAKKAAAGKPKSPAKKTAK